MVAAEAGIWDNYCVKKQLLRSWLWLPPTFSWLMRSWELECPLQKVEMKLALYLNPEDHRVILIIQLWNFAPIFKGFSFPILKKERTLAPIQILKFWNYNYSICKIALKCPHIAGHTYPVNRTFCFTLTDIKILDKHMLSTLLLNIPWKTKTKKTTTKKENPLKIIWSMEFWSKFQMIFKGFSQLTNFL